MKRNTAYTLLLLTVAAAPSVCRAQTETVTLEQCRHMAVSHNKEIAVSKVKDEQLSHDVKTYKSNFFPRVSLTAIDVYSTAKGDFTIGGGNLPIYSYSEALGQYVPDVTVNADGSYTLNKYALFPDQKMEYKVKNLFMGGINITQPIYMGGKVTGAYRMAKIGKDMAALNVSLTESEVIVKTEEAYFLAVKAKEMIQVAGKYKELLQELMKNVESAVSHGLKTRNDMMKVQVKLNEADLSVTKAMNAYRLACMNLCHYIGKPVTSTIDVTDAGLLGEGSYGAADGQIDITGRAEYAILNKKVELAGQQVTLTRSDYLPSVVFTGGYTYSNGAELGGRKLLDSGSAYASVGVSIPILNFGESTNKIRSAKASQRIAQLERDDLNEKMMLEQQQALNNVTEARKEVSLTQVAFEQAEENLKLSKQQYEVGFESLSDHLEAQAIWQDSYAAKVDALCQLNLAWVKYLKSRGEL